MRLAFLAALPTAVKAGAILQLECIGGAIISLVMTVFLVALSWWLWPKRIRKQQGNNFDAEITGRVLASLRDLRLD